MSGGAKRLAGIATLMALLPCLALMHGCSGIVSGNSSNSPSPSGVSVSLNLSAASVQVGGTQQFTATVTGSSNTTVTWTATGGTITAGGFYTAPASAGTFTVMATSTADTTKKALATVTVTATPPVVSITISPTSASLQTSATQQFTATVTGSSNTAVAWTATGGTVSSGGLYTAPATAGTFTVTATSVADTAKTAAAAVSVVLPTSTGAVNGWSSRIAGVNVPGGAASIVSSQGFESFLPTCGSAPCNSHTAGDQIYTQHYSLATPSLDSAIKADGNSSLKFTINSGSHQGDAGWYDYNFCAPVNTCVYGNGQEFFIQYKVRIDSALLGAGAISNDSSGGLKHDITTEGDTATTAAGDCSNSPGEVVTIAEPTGNAFQGPVMYNNCGSSGGTYAFMQQGYQPIQLGGIAGSNLLDQDAAGCPHYAGRGTPISDPTCFIYVGNEWFTIQKHIKVGTFGQPNSVIEQWIAHANSPSVLTTNASDAAIVNDGSGGASGKYGKIQLSTYDTGATFNVNSQVNFDDLIISTRRIPDPDVPTPNAPDSLNLSNVTSGSVTVNWRANSQNGMAQDDTGFLIERCAGNGQACLPNPQSGFAQIGTTAPGATSYVDSTVVPGSTYTYRVRAKNSSGNSAYTIAQCFNGGPSCGSTAVIP